MTDRGCDIDYINAETLAHALNLAHSTQADDLLTDDVEHALETRRPGWNTYVMTSGAQGDWLTISLIHNQR